MLSKITYFLTSSTISYSYPSSQLHSLNILSSLPSIFKVIRAALNDFLIIFLKIISLNTLLLIPNSLNLLINLCAVLLLFNAILSIFLIYLWMDCRFNTSNDWWYLFKSLDHAYFCITIFSFYFTFSCLCRETSSITIKYSFKFQNNSIFSNFWNPNSHYVLIETRFWLTVYKDLLIFYQRMFLIFFSSSSWYIFKY